MPERGEPVVRAEGQPASASDDAGALEPASPEPLTPEVVSPTTEALSEEDREEASLQVYGEYYAGPIPHPQILRQYGEIIPDGPNRILVMAEKQAEHRREQERQNAEHQREMERQTLDLQRQSFAAETKRSNMGLGAGLVVTLAGFALSYGTITAGHPIVGTVFGTGTLASLVGTFVYGTMARREERQQATLPDQQEEPESET